MCPATFSHLIPLPQRGRRILGELSEHFGSKATVAELGLEWGIRQGIVADPNFPQHPQIHVHLSKNYRAEYSPTHLGTILFRALDTFRGRVPNGFVEPPGVWYWSVELPKETLRAVRQRCFNLGLNPTADFATRFRQALLTVRQTLPTPDSALIEVPTDPATRDLYKETAQLCGRLGLEIDTLVADALVKAAKKD